MYQSRHGQLGLMINPWASLSMTCKKNQQVTVLSLSCKHLEIGVGTTLEACILIIYVPHVSR